MADDWILHLLERRDFLLRTIPALESRETQVSEMRDGERVDTTAEALESARDHLAEVERILNDHKAMPRA